MDASLHLILCAFDGVNKADEAAAAMREIDEQLDTVKLGNLAVIRKLPDGTVSVRDAHDARQALSRIAAPVVGAIAWFVSQVVGAPAPVAEATAEVDTEAAFTRWMSDGGFPDAALRAVGERIADGSSALVVLAKADEAAIVTSELVRLGGHMVERTLGMDLISRLTRVHTA